MKGKIKRNRRDDWIKFIFISILVVITLYSFIYISFSIRKDKFAVYADSEDFINTFFLLKDDKNVLSSYIFLYNKNSKKIAIFDFPVNFGTKIDTNGQTKVNKISLLYKQSGIDEYIKKVEEEFEFVIPYYFELDVKEIPKIVDLLGGFEIYFSDTVEKGLDNLQIKDGNLEDSIFLFEAGTSKLDGDKIASYLKLISQDKQEFAQNGLFNISEAFFKSLYKNADYLLQPEIKSRFLKSVHTNFNPNSFSSFVKSLKDLNFSNILRQNINGSIRKVEIEEGVYEDLFFPRLSGNDLTNHVAKIKASIEGLAVDTTKTQEKNLNQPIIVEILNATEVISLAKNTKDKFEKNKNFRVESVGNYFEYLDKSKVIDHKNKRQNAIDVSKFLGVDPNQVITDFDDTRNIDVTIILGKDYSNALLKNE